MKAKILHTNKVETIIENIVEYGFLDAARVYIYETEDGSVARIPVDNALCITHIGEIE